MKLFSNLCEAPVLFYTVCLFITAMHKTDHIHLTLAYLYLGLRWVHAYVFVFNNKPRLRAIPYGLSWCAMVGLYSRLLYQLW